MNIFLKGLDDNDMELVQTITKVIAHAIRNEIEDFHVKHLSDEQMKELNPLIRTAIFKTLFALANCDKDNASLDFISWHLRSIPGYWEAAELPETLLESFKTQQKRQIDFSSLFLIEQYQIGNIYYEPNSKCIQLLGSFEFIGISYENRKKLKSKITYRLKCEGYIYDNTKNGYIKPYKKEINVT